MIAGLGKVFKFMYQTIADTNTRLAIQNIELKLTEIDTRLTNLESRVKVGGL